MAGRGTNTLWYYQEVGGVNSLGEISIKIKVTVLTRMHAGMQAREVDLLACQWNGIVVHANYKTFQVKRNTHDIIPTMTSR